MDEQLVTNFVFRKTMTGAQAISSVWISDHETKSFALAPLESTGESDCITDFGVKSACECIH